MTTQRFFHIFFQLFIGGCVMFFPAWLSAEGAVRFDDISIEDGLSQSSITAIIQDQDGYMWFGTQEGVNRFDGYEFKIFKQDALSASAIGSNLINCIFEDRDGYIWLGSPTGGLTRLNKYNGEYKIFRRNEFSGSNTISHNSILRADAMFQDKLGHLWIITQGGGIDRFIPQTETFSHFAYDPENTGSLSSNQITGIREDATGNIWIATEDAGLNRFNRDTGTFIRFTKNNNLPLDKQPADDHIFVINGSSDDTILLGYRNGMVSLFDPASERFTHIDPLPNTDLPIFCIGEGRKAPGKIIWIGGEKSGLIKISRSASGSISTKRIYTKDLDGKVYPASIRRIHPDNSGNIWLIDTENRLQFFAPRQQYVSTLENDERFANEFASAIYEDRSGIIWIGTPGSGIAVYDHNKYKFDHHTLTGRDGSTAKARMIYALHESGKGVNRLIWAGSVNNGLYGYDAAGNLIHHFNRRPGSKNSLTDNAVRSILFDRDNTLWVGTGNGVSRVTGLEKSRPVFRNYYPEGPAPTFYGRGGVRSILQAPDGLVWMGTGNGLLSFHPNTEAISRYLYTKNPAQGEYTLTIFSLYLEPDSLGGNIWLGTNNGLYYFERSSGESFQLTENTWQGNNWISSISEDMRSGQAQFDQKRVLWLGTMGSGLIQVYLTRAAETRKPLIHKTVSFSERNGLPNNTVYAVLGDGSGKLWISSNQGLTSFDYERYRESPLLAFRNYDTDDGLQSKEFNLGAAYLAADGRMYFGGVNGFNSFHPDSIRENPRIPPVVITSFKKFDQAVSLDQSALSQQTIPLSYRENFFSFEFAALTYTNPEKNSYMYKLDGFNADWVPNGNRRYVNFTNVPPGEYIFRVKAANHDGLWNENAVSVSISITPPFWQSWWFYLLIAVALCGILLVIHKTRLSWEKQRIQEIERVKADEQIKKYQAIEHATKSERQRVRKKIAADFHDQSGHRLTKISLFCEVMKSQANGNLSEEDHIYLDKIMEASSHLHSDMTDFIWSLHPDEDTLYDTAVKLKDFGDKFFERTGIAFRVNGISKDLQKIPLNMEVRRNLIFIFKEGMNNILKHNRTHCSNVSLKIEQQENGYRIQLCDDGLGFEYNPAGNGRGIKNMQERAETISGSIKIKSLPGKGTTITLEHTINH